jgi:hypothetical protein
MSCQGPFLFAPRRSANRGQYRQAAGAAAQAIAAQHTGAFREPRQIVAQVSKLLAEINKTHPR